MSMSHVSHVSQSLGYMRAGAIPPAARGLAALGTDGGGVVSHSVSKKNLLYVIISHHAPIMSEHSAHNLSFYTPPPKSSSTLSSKLIISGLSGLGCRSKKKGHSDVLTKMPYGSLQSTNGLEW